MTRKANNDDTNMANKGDDRLRADGLPAGWVWTTIGEVAKINSRDPALRALPDNLPVTFLPMAAVDAVSGMIATPAERPLSTVRKGFTPFSNGDVLFAKITPCMENGKAAIARDLKNGRGFGSTEFHVFSPGASVIPEWIFYFIRQESFRRDAKAHFAGTAGQLRVPSSFLETYSLPLAPLPEQHRIVAKIEEQFTRLDAGVAALKRAQANLKRYKATVLKAACEGRLVAQDASDEPASVLLKRILAERRAKWAADLRAKGKDSQKAKYEEPQTPDVDALPELPQGWCWSNLAHFAKAEPNAIKRGPFGSTIKKEFFVERGYKVYEQKHAIQSDFSLGHYYISEEKFNELQEFEVRAGDLIISCSGTIGRVAIVPDDSERGIINQALLKISIDESVIDKRFFVFMFGARLQEVLVENTSGSAMQNISSVRVLRQKPYPLPPHAEQRRIVAEVERRLSVVQELEATLTANLARAERLRQSILKRAFEGKL